MFRASLAAMIALTLIPAVAQTQSRTAGNRAFDRAFDLSADAWCRDAWSDDNREAHCEVREEALSGLSSLDIQPGANGGIAVRGSNRSDVRLHYRITAWARNENDARDLASRVTVTSTGGRVRVNGPTGALRRSGWSVSVVADVPRELALTLTARNGGIVIDSVAGQTDAETVNGGIALRNVGGDFRGRTTNGGISAELTGSRWQGAGLDLETTNGGVNLSLPGDYSADLEAETSNGGLNIDFPITVQGRLNNLHRRISTQIGSGGPRLQIRTVNGGIRISRR